MIRYSVALDDLKDKIKALKLDAIHNRNDAAIVAAAKTNVKTMLRGAEPFANCLRCFHRLYQQSPDEAKQVFVNLSKFLDTVSP